jgi:predicted O-methyltransferase YrrM
MPSMGTLRRLAHSTAKRLLWRRHLAAARAQLAVLRAEARTPEEILTTPLRFRGRGYYQSLELRQNQVELSALLRLLRARELTNLCEIGTFRGGSLYIWCQIAQPGARVISVDLPATLFRGRHRRRSLPFFDSFRRPEQRLDFLFIDGDHSYLGARRDFEDYAPLVRPGGIVAIHDIVQSDARPEIEVWRLWQELKVRHDTVELVDPDPRSPKMGSGVVFAGGDAPPASSSG